MSADFKFDITENTLHLGGYLDAVGRVLTTDTELVSLGTRKLTDEDQLETLLGASLQGRSRVDRWSVEFPRFVREFLRLDDRQRLGSYLIDIVCFFEDFTEGAICMKLDCASSQPWVTAMAAYVLELEGNQRVLIAAYRINKAALPKE